MNVSTTAAWLPASAITRFRGWETVGPKAGSERKTTWIGSGTVARAGIRRKTPSSRKAAFNSANAFPSRAIRPRYGSAHSGRSARTCLRLFTSRPSLRGAAEESAREKRPLTKTIWISSPSRRSSGMRGAAVGPVSGAGSNGTFRIGAWFGSMRARTILVTVDFAAPWGPWRTRTG